MFSFIVKDKAPIITDTLQCIFFLSNNYDMKLSKSIIEIEEGEFLLLYPLICKTLSIVEDRMNGMLSRLDIKNLEEGVSLQSSKTHPILITNQENIKKYHISLKYGDGKGNSKILMDGEVNTFCMIGFKVIGNVLEPYVQIRGEENYKNLSFLQSLLSGLKFEYRMRILHSIEKEERVEEGSTIRNIDDILEENNE